MHNKKGLKPINDVARHRIDELRKEAGMTQDVYGREVLHCSQGTASQKLSGQLALSAVDIWRTALVFNVSTDLSVWPYRHTYERYDTCIKHLESVDELQFASERRMKPSSTTKLNNRKETGTRPVICTVNRGESDSHSPRQPRNV